MSSLPIGCMRFLFSKTVRHHFWPGLIPRIINYCGGTYATSMFSPNICHEFIPIGGINIPTFVWLDAWSKVQVPSYNIKMFFECMSFHLWEWLWFWLCELFVHIHLRLLHGNFELATNTIKILVHPKPPSQGEPALTSVPFTRIVWVIAKLC
jgi:hypothetical protein